MYVEKIKCEKTWNEKLIKSVDDIETLELVGC